MQNRKFKLLAITAGLTVVSMMASAQLATPQTVQAPATAPAVKVVSATDMSPSAYSLEEIAKLRAIKSKLETERDVAKLEAEIKDIKSGKKAGSNAGSGASASNTPNFPTLMPNMPNFSQMMASSGNNVAVSAIYGSNKKLTAEITVGRTKVLGRVGTVLSTGETIQSIEADHIVLTQGKKVRKVSPTTESGVPYSAPGMAMPSAQSGMPGQGGAPSMIQPFNPADLISAPAPIVSDVPLNVNPATKTADVM
jgi:type IV pilus biogenesis protein PilP